MKRLVSVFLILIATALNGLSQAIEGTNINDYATPKREVRAVWLTTIGGLDWPKTYASTQRGCEAQKRQLCETLDILAKANINTILLQTRIRGTVIYPSTLEPWDGCMSGKPGKSPGYDPLKFAIEECHKRGMEIHAWIVTIPVGKWDGTGCKTLRNTKPGLIFKLGNEGFMRPEKKETANYIANICKEVTDNYDIDGIHLDYIRYPENLKLSISRQQARENISYIVKTVSETVKKDKPWVKISCSPIGKRNDLNRYSSRGWNAEEKGCQDVKRWLSNGWMDQIYPMMYFRNDNFYPFAADWKENSYGRTVSAGLGIYFLSPKEANWQLNDITGEMNFCRQFGIGTAMFRGKFFTDNTKGIFNYAANELYRYPALVPEMTWHPHQRPEKPTNIKVERGNDYTKINWNRVSAPDIYYNVYASEKAPVDINDARNLVAMRTAKDCVTIPSTAHTQFFAITAIDRFGKESEPLQSDPNVNTSDDLTSPAGFIANIGNTIHLPQKPSCLDAEYIILTNNVGMAIATKPFSRTINIGDIPNGMYTIKSLSQKGTTHRICFVKIEK